SMCRFADGTTGDVSVQISPIFSHDKVVGASAIARDISRLAETRRALEDEQRKVRALLQRREEFLAMLAHELRNPLSAGMNAATGVDEGAAIEARTQCRAVIKRQTRHMKRMLDDMLDVSRVTTDKLTLDLDDIDLRESIDVAIESTAPLYAERHVKLVREVP